MDSSRTAQLCNARKDTSHESFVILVLSTPSRLPLANCFIACMFAVRIHDRRLYGGHEMGGRYLKTKIQKRMPYITADKENAETWLFTGHRGEENKIELKIQKHPAALHVML